MGCIFIIFFECLKPRFSDVEPNTGPRHPVLRPEWYSVAMCRTCRPRTIVTGQWHHLRMTYCYVLSLWTLTFAKIFSCWLLDLIVLFRCVRTRCLEPEGWASLGRMGTMQFAKIRSSAVVEKCLYLGFAVPDRTFMLSVLIQSWPS